ncbi:hypothetical protein PSA7680_02718 [Pseudoruegeria aquimaris]|uniref:Glycosyltransferase RgtA/B/C/D-like domain-containing protein n=1 Tax=Pseudoruegeria aquimaris TaxID=393663 RepID=A0A1Y5SZU7_9RHOB|nr:glycosyltransferase family 39 protein [Pseudoruegeria aquimaris]SLN52145.1 hypothetical protein PSA7680_02718 [Pseudoruegeria aquimaris]
MSRPISALFAVVLAVTAARLLLLALTPTDLFFDEAQYWAWSRQFDFGYFSKPPLIAWVIGFSTWLGGSDAPFWVRAPAPVLHGITALILGLWMGRIHKPAAPWVAALYLAMPVLAIGSWMFSTDTIMAPFLAGALWAWWAYLDSRRLPLALLAGLLAGCAIMGKYAGVYFWVTVAVAAFFPALRPRLSGVAVAAAACLAVISPNLIWNLTHGLVTFQHTAHNAQAGSGIAMNWAGLAEFLASQTMVIGPLFFIVWIALLWRAKEPIERYLLAASIPVLLIITWQSWAAEANANWAFAAYPPAAALVGLALVRQGRLRYFRYGLAFNLALVLAFSVLLVAPSLAPRLTDRYTGRAELMNEIIARADGRPIAVVERQILADLTYTAAQAADAPPIYAMDWDGPPRHWYDMVAPRPENTAVLYVSKDPDFACNGHPLAPEGELRPEGGAYKGRTLTLFALPADCR